MKYMHWRMDKLEQKTYVKSKLKLAGLSVLLAAGSVLSGCSLLPEEQKPLKPPLVQPAQAEVRTVEAVKGSIVRQLVGSGVFVPTEIGYYQFKDGGNIKTVEVRAGHVVEKGDVLATLENNGADIELLQREIDYERKKIALRDAMAGGNNDHIRIAKLELELATLLFDNVKKRAAGTVLRADNAGVVTFAADARPGDWIDAKRVVAAVADPSGMRIALDVGANPVMKDIKVGMAAEVIFREQTLAGKVSQTPSSAPLTDDARLREEYGKTIYIELEELPSDAVLGSSAEIRIVAARKDNTVVLPKRGVRTYFGRTFVQVLDGERRREVDVETGLENATEIEIVQGLEEGAQVILQ